MDTSKTFKSSEEPCFIFKGEDYFAPCVFQVWERRDDERDVSIKRVKPVGFSYVCLLYTSPSPRDATLSRMPSYS